MKYLMPKRHIAMSLRELADSYTSLKTHFITKDSPADHSDMEKIILDVATVLELDDVNDFLDFHYLVLDEVKKYGSTLANLQTSRPDLLKLTAKLYFKK